MKKRKRKATKRRAPRRKIRARRRNATRRPATRRRKSTRRKPAAKKFAVVRGAKRNPTPLAKFASGAQAKKVASWLRSHFGGKVRTQKI